MAGYDPEKDKTLKEWRCPETGLMVSINQYGEGEPKLQIGPRMIMKKDGSEGRPAKAGRLTIEDVQWLYDTFEEIKEELESLSSPLK